MDDLVEQLSRIAKRKSINPLSNVIQLIQSLPCGYGSIIELDLNSKEELFQLAELVQSAIDMWINEEYFKHYDYEENKKIINPRRDMYNHLAKRLREIAAHEWKAENLFINRAYTLQPMTQSLLHFAKKNIDTNSHLMKFLKLLANREIKDIDIRSKKELEQFIELAKLSLQALKKQGYFKQYDATRDNNTFNYVEYNYLSYIQRLKEIEHDWDNAISDEWKNGKSVISTKFKPEAKPSIKPSILQKPTVKEFLKQSLLYFLMLIITIIILWVICSIIKYLS